MLGDWVSIGYLFSAALFIFGLKQLGHPRTAPRGNQTRCNGHVSGRPDHSCRNAIG